MSRYFLLSQGWKATIETVGKMMYLLCVTFMLPVAVEAATYRIEMDNGHLYDVTIGAEGNVGSFSVRSLEGESLRGRTNAERDTTAELYGAAKLLWIAGTYYSSEAQIPEREKWVNELAEDTRKKLKWNKVAAAFGGMSFDLLVAVTTGGTLSIGNKLTDVLGVVNGVVADELENSLLLNATALAVASAREATLREEKLYELYQLSVARGAIISIRRIRSGWVDHFELAKYGQLTTELMGRYLKVPDTKERLKTFFKGLIPVASNLQTLSSIMYTADHLQRLSNLSKTAYREFHTDAVLEARRLKGKFRIQLQEAGFFPMSTDFPDLIVESISASVTSSAPGGRFRLDTTVENQGEAASKPTTLRFYQSSDPNISPDDTELHAVSVNGINVGRQITPWKRFTAPDVPGVYYYGVCVDRADGEHSIDNNCSEAIKITVLQPTLPDLIVESISVSKSTLTPGERFTLSATVRNIGTARSQSGVLRYYEELSEAGNKNIRRLFPDQTTNMSIQLVAPKEPGVYYYDACVSKVRDEVNKDNNCSNRIPITVDIPVNQVPVVSDPIPEVPVANRAPVTVGVMGDLRLSTNSSTVFFDLSNYFRDPDGDTLTYTTTSDNPNVAFLQVIGVQLNILPFGTVGRANVTVTASDGSAIAIQRFSVTIRAVPAQNQAPRTVGTIPSQTLKVGIVGVGHVSKYFTDSDGDRLTYTARSDDTRVVTTSMSGDTLTLTPEHPGSATVTVTASDGSSIATQHFTVRVEAERSTQPVNQPPSAIGTIAPQTLTVNDAARRMNISGYFQDSDRDRLTYTARSDNTSVATVSVSGSEVTITPQRAGNTTLHVTASDGSLGATQSISVTVASAPPVQDPASFDLAIQSVRVSKDTLVPGESFTLSITIHNNGPGTSEAPFLSYYYSLIQGRTPEDQIHREGTVQLTSLASGANTTKSFTLTAPSTPKTYYYGAWLSGITNDTNLYNDVATEVGVVVQPPQQPPVTIPQPIQRPPDLVVESVRVSDDTLAPRERFTLYAMVRNQGTGEASRTTLRYYRSSDATISTTDTAVDTDSVTSLDPAETAEESDSLRAPDQAGVYYYGACVDSVTDESNTRNNCSRAIRVTVKAAEPDLVVESARSSDMTVEVGERFTFYATVRNRGNGEARRTTLRYYRSSDSNISDRDTKEDTDSVSSLDADETSNERVTLTAPNQSGVYYYGACVDRVTGESNTNNNCSTGIRVTVADAIIVRPPPAGLAVGDSIVVQNASGGGLNGLIVRSGAGTGFKHIISVFNGATGTITDGPESANGYTWWKVSWDRSNQVFCDVNPCVGWVIEFFQGTRVIAEDGLAAPTLNAIIPTETTLFPNYPNPFNPETWIPYQLSVPTEVNVSIYSVNGHLIRTLDLGHQPAGVYQSRSRAAYWDGRNEFGEPVASGVYFYTLTASDFTATRRMLILK